MLHHSQDAHRCDYYSFINTVPILPVINHDLCARVVSYSGAIA
ncbi:hypothetical protein PCIT_a1727 [Pseudoalteromonas citrea]|uniref:Uncharacterized protein n=1 Tax=Pseudoalteromonas citrea TaxID=43655 RepID=A0AAD4AMN2_9GAMM|nr:hypothetical protein PCIT_a1727 [Pseudoalteromonas citrea]